jgi:cyanophycinase
MYKKTNLFYILLIFIGFSSFAQLSASSGKLFIIGGGKRTGSLMKSMLSTAQLRRDDFIIVLPMASEEPDSAFYYFQTSLKGLTTNSIAVLNFADGKMDPLRIDSIRKARLIFIAGGDQSRFMKSVLHTPVFTAIHFAYEHGATIAGTSAGAAVMSKYMITGKEIADTVYHETFRRVWTNNLQVEEGLGLLPNAIIDQHFIVRSRYNRLITALAKYPRMPCIGIDESTAIIVNGSDITVAGEGQVVLLAHPHNLKIVDNKLIKFQDIQLSIFTAGDHFKLINK